ncbi:MAG: hypothetical protein ACLR23_15460 [Clostridia bacterium]
MVRTEEVHLSSKNFMEMLIIPNIEDENERIRTVDELPQSSNGKTIMTTELRFIPKRTGGGGAGETRAFVFERSARSVVGLRRIAAWSHRPHGSNENRIG